MDAISIFITAFFLGFMAAVFLYEKHEVKKEKQANDWKDEELLRELRDREDNLKQQV